MTDRVSAEGLRRYRAIINANGAMEFIEDPDGALVTYADVAALRDTGPRSDSGIDDHEHDHDCQSGNGKTHRHEYRHTHPVEHLHRHEHPTDEQVARRIALSTPRTETSDTVRIGSKTYLAGSDDD